MVGDSEIADVRRVGTLRGPTLRKRIGAMDAVEMMCHPIRHKNPEFSNLDALR